MIKVNEKENDLKVESKKIINKKHSFLDDHRYNKEREFLILRKS